MPTFPHRPSLNDVQRSLADRLVFDERDLWQALNDEQVATIRLGGDIILTRAMQLSGAYNKVIEGGGKHRIAPVRGGSIDAAFTLDDAAVSDLTFRGVVFDMLGAVFSATGTSSLDRVSLDGCSIKDTTGDLSLITLLDGPGPFAWDDSTITIRSTAAAAVALGNATFSGTLNSSSELVSTYVAGAQKLSVDSNGLVVGGAVGTTAQVSLDVHGALAVRQSSVTLSGANPALTVGDLSYIAYNLDATTSGTISIGLPPGAAAPGQLLYLRCVANAGSAQFVDGSGRFEGSANLTPGAQDTLTLLWDGTSWVELARSNN